jgi:hypothetical protein
MRSRTWYDELPYGRTTEKLLMIVRAILAHARVAPLDRGQSCSDR